ncbi:MAG: undecaprenyl-phosphate glucose phosphotransferase, partial [Methylococcales bacterium]|nr:undecaprenyl-phosphate glucose phosphotransferase [Methylococcales bacterium]
RRITQGVIALVDCTILWGLGFFIYFQYVGWSNSVSPAYPLLLSLNTSLMIGVFFFSKLYEVEPIPRLSQQIKKIIIILSLLFASLIVFLFIFKISSSFSRAWLIYWYIFSVPSICVARTLFYFFLRKYAQEDHLTRNVVIFGAGGQAIKLVHAIQKEEYPWLRIVGCFDDRSERIPSVIGEYPIEGDINSLIHFIRDNRCEEVLIALPWTAEERIRNIVQQLKILPVTVRLVPDLVGINYSQCVYDDFSGVPMLTILNKPMLDWDFVLKAIEDRIFAALFLTMLLPLFIIISVLIKFNSPGPVFFRQKRYGFNNNLIEVYKFRTMKIDQQDSNAETLVTRNDPRVTRLGAFLRRSSLDELPQLINVLKGEMSIVGPRPHALQAKAAGKLYDQAVFGYAERHKVKPGITGWAQVNGWRGETDTNEKIVKRVEYDLHYIYNWSLFFDFLIMFRTIWVLFKQENAY